jgi:NADH dehydrogenase (ubiquinone) Fe-S protein 1
MVIFGGGLLESKESEVAANFLSYLRKGVPGLHQTEGDYLLWSGLNILLSGANQVGQMDLGVNTVSSDESKTKVLILFGADNYEVKDQSKGLFVIYIGHHGDVNAPKADIILPGAAFTEKSASYVNAEGRPQETGRVFLAPDLAREDWKIIRALSEFMDQYFTLPYHNAETLKEHLVQVSPSFLSKDEVLQKPSGHLVAFDSRVESPVGLSRNPLRKKVTDFYKTDAISRASRVMTKCSSAYKKTSNFI